MSDDADYEAKKALVKARAHSLAAAAITARDERELVRDLLAAEASDADDVVILAEIFAYSFQILVQYVRALAVYLDRNEGEGSFERAHRESVLPDPEGGGDGG